MKNAVFALLAVLALLAGSCSPFAALRPKRPTPEQRAAATVAELLQRYPGLVQPETVQVRVPFAVPEIHFERELVPIHDTIYVQREATTLDSLLAGLQGRLDSAQRVATTAQLHRMLLDRPVLRDTLCFDTLGVAGKFWRVGRTYRLLITRGRIDGHATGPVVLQQLGTSACPGAEPFSLFRPRTWGLPWYAWQGLGLLLGLLLGLVLGFLLCRTLTRRANA
jgi:hypothetical protein